MRPCWAAHLAGAGLQARIGLRPAAAAQHSTNSRPPLPTHPPRSAASVLKIRAMSPSLSSLAVPPTLVTGCLWWVRFVLACPPVCPACVPLACPLLLAPVPCPLPPSLPPPLLLPVPLPRAGYPRHVPAAAAMYNVRPPPARPSVCLPLLPLPPSLPFPRPLPLHTRAIAHRSEA